MTAGCGFAFKKWRLAGGIDLSFTTDRLGFGGGIVIDPQGDHPNIFANFLCAFFLISTRIYFCAHSLKDHA